MTQSWLISTDLDGTLLQHDGRVSLVSQRVFAQLHQRGHQIVLASGRPWDEMASIAATLHIPCSVIACNGAWIGDTSGKALIEHVIHKDVVVEMTQLLENVQAAVIVTLENERVLLDIGRPSLRRKSIVEPLVQPTDLQMDKIFKITLALDDDNAEEMTDILTSRFGDSAAVVRSDPRTIDINAAGTSKGRGIQEFTQLMGISLEHSIAFGNEMNDAAMLETVSIGVAVANANPNLFPFAKNAHCRQRITVSRCGSANFLNWMA